MKPFTDVWFKDCHHMALLTILNLYKIDNSNLLLNQIYYYDIYNGKIVLKCIDQKNVYDILQLNGLVCIDHEYIVESTELIHMIYESPIIIGIDCFYESIRKDCYKKRHMLHSLVIYKYSNEFAYVVEQPSFFSSEYKIYKNSLNEIIQAHNSYLQNINNDDYSFRPLKNICYLNGRKPSLLTFNKADVKREKYKFEEYLITLQNNTDSIKNGLLQIINYSNYFDIICSQNKKYLIEQVEYISDIILNKKIECYIWCKFLNDIYEKGIIVEKTNQVIKQWILMRKIIAKMIYSEEVDASYVYNAKKVLNCIYDEELHIVEIWNKLIKRNEL